eukprot:1141469-Pelagomonas_calceolata.AAC.10
MDTYHQGDLARVYLHSRRSMPPLCALMRQCAHFPPCMPQRKSQFGAASFADSKQECPRPELHHSRIRVMDPGQDHSVRGNHASGLWQRMHTRGPPCLTQSISHRDDWHIREGCLFTDTAAKDPKSARLPACKLLLHLAMALNSLLPVLTHISTTGHISQAKRTMARRWGH